MGDDKKPHAKPSTKLHNLVAEDDSWKETLRKTTMAQIQTWPLRWNWLLDENIKMYDALAGKRAFSPYDWTRWDRPPQPLPKLPPTPRAPDGRVVAKKPPAIFLPPIPDKPAKTNIPRTTSGWYGFVPKVQGRNLVGERQQWCERKGQHNLTTLFCWPDIFD